MRRPSAVSTTCWNGTIWGRGCWRRFPSAGRRRAGSCGKGRSWTRPSSTRNRAGARRGEASGKPVAFGDEGAHRGGRGHRAGAPRSDAAGERGGYHARVAAPARRPGQRRRRSGAAQGLDRRAESVPKGTSKKRLRVKRQLPTSVTGVPTSSRLTDCPLEVEVVGALNHQRTWRRHSRCHHPKPSSRRTPACCARLAITARGLLGCRRTGDSTVFWTNMRDCPVGRCASWAK